MSHTNRNITPYQLITETIGVSNLLSRKQIGVEFSEEGEACTDGNKIVLPEININKPLTKKAATVFRGLVDHESAHVRFTDFDTLETIKDKPEYIKLLLNIIEDIRIDKKISKEYSGSTINIDELCNHSIDEMHNQFASEKNEAFPLTIHDRDTQLDEEAKLDDKSLGILYLHLLGMKSRGITNQNLEILMELIPSHIKNKLSKLEDQINDIDNTFDALSVAENAAHLIGFKPGKLSKEEEELIERIMNLFSKLLLEEIGKLELKKAMEEGLEGLEDSGMPSTLEMEQLYNYFIPTTEFDEYRPVRSWRTKANRDLQTKNHASLLKPLQNLLKTEVYVAKELSEIGKKLDPKSLVRAFQGHEKVFQKKSLDKDLDTAILFAVDASGSMAGSKTETAFSSAYALCRCLDSMNVKTKVTSFTTGDILPHIEDLRHSGSRYEALKNLIHKDWNESTFEKRHHFHPENQWNNADGESLMIFGRDLLNQAESKKIMLVLSDGYPAATYRGQDNAMLKHSIKYLENQGLILGSIGIESYAPERFYKNNIVINQLSDLPSALTELCGKLMTDKEVYGNR